jgi:hypothetical protein
MPRPATGRTIAESGFFVGGRTGMPQWRTRFVASATVLLVLAVSLGGAWLQIVPHLYLDW